MPETTLPVLIVDDHPVNQKVLQVLLQYLGYPCHLACSGKQAIEKARQNQYAVILMDIMMPEIDGFAATQQIRELEFATGRRTPIIAVTALNKDDIREQCLAAGMDDYISKPISKEILHRKLDHWVPVAMTSSIDDYQSEVVGVASGDDPIDRTRMELLYEISDLEPILNLFLEVTEPLLSQLHSAIGDKNVPLVCQTAHELKGSSYAVSAREMAKLSLELEEAGQQERWAEAVKIYTALACGFLRVKEYLSCESRKEASEAPKQ